MAFRKLATATKKGSRLEQLKAMAVILAKQIDDCESGRDLAALSRQYRETVKEIEDIEGDKRDDDDIAQILGERADTGKPGAVR